MRIHTYIIHTNKPSERQQIIQAPMTDISVPCVHVGMCFEVLSVLLGIGIHTVFYTIFVIGGTDVSCDQGERLPNEDERSAYRWHAVLLGVLTIFFISVTVFGVKEQDGEFYIERMLYRCIQVMIIIVMCVNIIILFKSRPKWIRGLVSSEG